MGPSANVDIQFAQPELSEEEILLREEFAKEYCDDFNAIAACIRLGILGVYAEDWANLFMSEGVTRHLIRERQNYLLTTNFTDYKEELKSEVIQELRRAGHLNGPDSNHGSRVTAWVSIAKILGMLDREVIDPGHGVSGGVMIVPAMISPEEWGNEAVASQKQLKATVKD